MNVYSEDFAFDLLAFAGSFLAADSAPELVEELEAAGVAEVDVGASFFAPDL